MVSLTVAEPRLALQNSFNVFNEHGCETTGDVKKRLIHIVNVVLDHKHISPSAEPDPNKV